MNTADKSFFNASVVTGGTVCAVMAVNDVLGHVPGLGLMCGLCFPILSFWVGTLLRKRVMELRRWLCILLAAAALFFLYRYRHFAENGEYSACLYLAMGIAGFLLPTKALLSSRQDRGWIPLGMAALAVFCYTAVAVVKNRLLWGPLMPDYPDMELMMETLLVNAEPLMAVIAIFFVMRFSFSQLAQGLGSKGWFRVLAAIPCIYAFALSIIGLAGMRLYFFAGFTPLMCFAVQPVTVWLVACGPGFIRKNLPCGSARCG